MLRGIRKASANWLGRIVMGVVMTLLAGSFAVGASTTFFAVSAARRWRRSAIRKSRLNSSARPITIVCRKSDRKLAIRFRRNRRRRSALTVRFWARWCPGRARPACAANGSRHPRCRDSHGTSRQTRRSRPQPVNSTTHGSSWPAQRRVHGTAVCRRATPCDVAPANHQVHSPATSRYRTLGATPSISFRTKSAASSTWRWARRKQAKFRNRPPTSSTNISASGRFCFALRNTARS